MSQVTHYRIHFTEQDAKTGPNVPTYGYERYATSEEWLAMLDEGQSMSIRFNDGYVKHLYKGSMQ